MPRLEPGNRAPAFTLKNQDAAPIKLTELKGQSVLLYFYPKANTPGCTTQACELQDALGYFNKLDVIVLGVSPDEPEALAKFAKKYKLKFDLLSDPDHKIADKYGVWGEKSMYGRKYMGIIRSSFLIGPTGKLEQCWYKISPKKTVPEAQKVLGK